MEPENVYQLIISVLCLLLAWSEYLGLTPSQKANAIIELITCMLKKNIKEEPVNTQIINE